MLQEVAKNEYDNLFIGISLIGARFDANDFWLVGGVLMCIVFQIFSQHLDRELKALQTADAVCPNNRCRELIVMAVVFTAGRTSSKDLQRPGSDEDRPPEQMRNSRLQAAFLRLLMFLPPVLNTMDFFSDLQSNSITLMAQYNGPIHMYVEYAIQGIFVGALWWICIWCYQLVKRLQTQVGHISRHNYSVAAP